MLNEKRNVTDCEKHNENIMKSEIRDESKHFGMLELTILKKRIQMDLSWIIEHDILKKVGENQYATEKQKFQVYR